MITSSSLLQTTQINEPSSSTPSSLVYVLVAVISTLVIYVAFLAFYMYRKHKRKQEEKERKEKEKEAKRQEKKKGKLDKTKTQASNASLLATTTQESTKTAISRANSMKEPGGSELRRQPTMPSTPQVQRVPTIGKSSKDPALESVKAQTQHDTSNGSNTSLTTTSDTIHKKNFGPHDLGAKVPVVSLTNPELWRPPQAMPQAIQMQPIYHPMMIKNQPQMFNNANQTMMAELYTSNNSTRSDGATITNIADLTIETGENIAVPAFLHRVLALDFKLDKVIAEGGASVVYLGTAVHPELIARAGDSPSIIIKQMKGKDLSFIVVSQDKKFNAAFTQELSVMWFLRAHQNIAKIIGFSFQPPMILMRFYPNGVLSKYIRDYKSSKTSNSRRYKKRQCLTFLKDIGKGLAYMHQNGIVHLDMKTGNILLDTDEVTKELIAIITDFGLAQILDPHKIVVTGFQVSKLKGHSLVYAAPEIIAKNQIKTTTTEIGSPTMTIQEYNPKEYMSPDVYSYGMIIWEMLHRKTPWKK